MMHASEEPSHSNVSAALAPERKSAIVAALRELLPRDGVLWQDEQLRPYECDGLTAFRQQPVAVVLPRNDAQICETLSICRQFDVPVVARGSGTGLSGGAMPHAAGVVLSLAR